MIVYIISGVITIIIIFTMIMIVKVSKVNDLKDNIKETRKNLSTLLNKKYNILNSVRKFLKTNFKVELEKIEKSNLEEEYDMELDKNLNILNKDFNDIIENTPKIQKEKKIDLFKTNLKDIDENIYGLKSYYNDNVQKINKLLEKPLYKLAALITKTEKYKKFDIKKEADLEILKD